MTEPAAPPSWERVDLAPLLAAPRVLPARFGPWHFDRDLLTLRIPVSGAYVYEVDVERMRTSAACLDIIVQVAHKRWATDEIVGSLVAAVQAILDPQGTLCSMGAELGPIDVRRTIDRRHLR